MSTVTTSEQLSSNQVKLIPRPNHERGGGNHGWLKTFHTFSFADYMDADHTSYGSLRVINEDRVEPSKGFGTHGHREMEIFSYIVSGELEHKDSMGNVEILRRGDIQLTSAGTGIRHSEFNANTKEQVHFLQIWAVPSKSKLPPKYFTRHFTDEEKMNKLVTVVAPIGAPEVSEDREGTGPTPVQSPLSLKAAILSPSKSVEHTFPAPAEGKPARKSYVHVIQTSGYNTGKSTGNRVRVNGGLELAEGDGAYASGQEGDTIHLENIGEGNAEILVFDIE
ncbi:hypothetical protein FRC02_007386 [Tulasnella sp. 418]|nr:hypothetical protein FRC02_007386 [Tulasnella sp. 418]